MRLLYAFLLLLAFAARAYGGAWTQGAGRYQVIDTQYAYSTDSYYDNSGHKQRQPLYRKYENNPYMEYGWDNDWTLGANLSFQKLYQAPPTPTLATPVTYGQARWGLGDSEFFVRHKLWEQDGFIISTQPLIKLPAPYHPKNDTLPLGGHHPDVELALSGGYGFSTGSLNHFVNIDTAYRYRFGDPKDQLKLSLTAGANVMEQVLIMPQLFVTGRLHASSSAAFTHSADDDYQLIKAQLSAVYIYDKYRSFQLGAFMPVAGKNTGGGAGGFLGMWYRF